MTSRLRGLFAVAFSEADRLKDEYVSTEHILLALAEDTGPAGKILRTHGLTHKSLEMAIVDIRGGRRVTDQHSEDRYQALEKYGVDLTARARQDPSSRARGRRAPP